MHCYQLEKQTRSVNTETEKVRNIKLPLQQSIYLVKLQTSNPVTHYTFSDSSNHLHKKMARILIATLLLCVLMYVEYSAGKTIYTPSLYISNF
jgi:hypothetical protein